MKLAKSHQNLGQVPTLTFFILVLSTLKDVSPVKVLTQMNECEPLALFIQWTPKFPGLHTLAELILS